MKEGARILGIDDSPFDHSDERSFLTGVVYRGTELVEDIKKVDIRVDGENATGKIMGLHDSCNNPGQITAILLDGVSFAGFNVVDLDRTAEEAGKPVISVTPNEPDRKRFRQAMENSGNTDENFGKLPEYSELEMKDGTVYVQYSGCSFPEAEDIIRSSTIYGLVPEPIRVADMIGSAFREFETVKKEE
ncbi:MAG: DUF99 family protein [Candidatus Nanohaloarchaea archaeon]